MNDQQSYVNLLTARGQSKLIFVDLCNTHFHYENNFWFQNQTLKTYYVQILEGVFTKVHFEVFSWLDMKS